MVIGFKKNLMLTHTQKKVSIKIKCTYYVKKKIRLYKKFKGFRLFDYYIFKAFTINGSVFSKD